MFSNEMDTEDITQARLVELECIKDWIAEAKKKKKVASFSGGEGAGEMPSAVTA
jgi:hypothetical protein